MTFMAKNFIKSISIPNDLSADKFISEKTIYRFLLGKSFDLKVAYNFWEDWVKWYIKELPHRIPEEDK